MATRKRKNDEELVALPSDESEEEEEYVLLLCPDFQHRITAFLSASSATMQRLNWQA